jgi:galactonate dehydratase
LSRIASIETLSLRISPKTVWTFLKVVDGEGRIGLGEATLNAREAEVAAVAARLAPRLTGAPADPAVLDEPVPERALPEAAVASALDQALWDLRGQREGKPVWQLLGLPRRRRVPLYANINRRTVDRGLQGFATSTRHAAATGFTRFKVAPFDDLTPAIADSEAGRKLIDLGVDRVAAVREAAGPRARVMVDCHWRFTERAAEETIGRLAELGVDWFECPLPETVETIPALHRLRLHANEHGVQLAGLEMSPAPSALVPFLEGDCYDVVMPDIKYIGGFAGMLQAGALCARYDVGCAPHNPTGPICHAASLHASAVLDSFDLLEHQHDESPLFDRLVGGALPDHVSDMSTLPWAPGLGVGLDPRLASELRA